MSTETPDRTELRSRARARLITLTAQALSVVFAVLVALAIDEWWESREDAELGRRGAAAIRAEIRNNLEALESRRPEMDSVLAGIDTALRAMEAGAAAESMSIVINYPVAFLSSAAWHTAQVTRAVNFMEIDQVIAIAGSYDLQAFFLRNQERLTDMIADMGSAVDAEPARVIAEVGLRYRQVSGFRDGLIIQYRCLLNRLPRGDDEPLEPCPEEESAGPAGLTADTAVADTID